MVAGTVEGAVRQFVERRAPQRGAALSGDLLQAISKWLRLTTSSNVLAAQLAADDTFSRSLEILLLKARRGAWSIETWQRSVMALLERYATVQGGVGQALASFLHSALVAPSFEGARADLRREPEVAVVVPYLMYWTRDDEAVRENHQALHEFVAAADWNGWEQEAMCPHGWRCRCRMIEIAWTVARRRKYKGRFPKGVAKLTKFRRLGGSDSGFPREDFVVGALAATAS